MKVGFTSDKERQCYFEKNSIYKMEKPRVNTIQNDKKIEVPAHPLSTLEQIKAANLGEEDVLSLIKQALKADASLGQIVQALKILEVRTTK